MGSENGTRLCTKYNCPYQNYTRAMNLGQVHVAKLVKQLSVFCLTECFQKLLKVSTLTFVRTHFLIHTNNLAANCVTQLPSGLCCACICGRCVLVGQPHSPSKCNHLACTPVKPESLHALTLTHELICCLFCYTSGFTTARTLVSACVKSTIQVLVCSAQCSEGVTLHNIIVV